MALGHNAESLQEGRQKRASLLIKALCDVSNYENAVHGTALEVNCAKWQSLVDHVLAKATYVCLKDGKPTATDV